MNEQKRERRRQAERDAVTDQAFRELRARVATLEDKVLRLQRKVVDLSNGPVRVIR